LLLRLLWLLLLLLLLLWLLLRWVYRLGGDRDLSAAAAGTGQLFYAALCRCSSIQSGKGGGARKYTMWQTSARRLQTTAGFSSGQTQPVRTSVQTLHAHALQLNPHSRAAPAPSASRDKLAAYTTA
jgi:hypothetical protein